MNRTRIVLLAIAAVSAAACGATEPPNQSPDGAPSDASPLPDTSGTSRPVDARDAPPDAALDTSGTADGSPDGDADAPHASGPPDADASPDASGTSDGAPNAAVDASEAGRDARRADSQGGPEAAADVKTTPDAGPDAGPFLLRGQARTWHVTSTVTVDNHDATLTKLAVILPAPQSNIYQDVSNLAQGSGTLIQIQDTDDSYVRFSPSGALPAPGTIVSYAISYDVTLYDLSVDFSQVTSVPPYDISAPEYTRYTGSRDVYVDPDNATITSIASSLATRQSDVLAYAKAAYEYVASHYQYLDPNTGLHPLTEILTAGGGDCGNLTSIYVSLLRHRGIPARHLVAIRPDGSYHVWADFLLQGYGWVPVDVTYKQENPAGDYFGKVALGTSGIIMDKQVWLALDIGGSTEEIPLLQNYAWWFWSSTSSPTVTTSYLLTAVSK